MRALAERSPERVVEPLAKMLADDTGTAEVAALAASVASTLRRAGVHARVVELANAGASRSRRLRAEGVLAAIASGNDAAARALAAGDASVEALLGPLVDALAGAAPTRPKSPPPLARALYSVSKAVFEAGAGRRERAKAAVAAIPAATAPPVFGHAMRAAIEVAYATPAGVAQSIGVLLADARVRARGPLVETMLREAIPRGVGAIGEEPLRSHGLLGALRLARAARLRDRLADGAPPQEIEKAVLELGPDAFEGEDRARAFLFAGFGQLARRDAAAADAAFDRAVAASADLVEALRGKALAQYAKGDARAGAQLYERLARALEHDVDGRPFAVEALCRAAEAWGTLGRDAEALAAIARARAMLAPDDVGSLTTDLDHQEALAVHGRDPARADAILTRILGRNPRDRSAWEGRIAIAERRGDRAALRARLEEAVAATGDAKFARELRAERARSGSLSPFEGMTPGATAVDDLVAEARRLVAANLLDRAALDRFRAPLDPRTRAAVDVAIAVALLKAERVDEARALWRDGAARVVDDTSALTRQVHVALHLELDDVVAAFAREHASSASRPALAALAAAANAGGAGLGGKVLAAVHARLDAIEVKRLQRGARSRLTGVIERTIDELESIVGPLDSDDELVDADAEVDVDVDVDDERTPALHAIFAAVGRDCAPIHALDPATRERFEATIAETLDGRKMPGPAVLDVLRRLGIQLPALLDAVLPPARRRSR